MSRILDIQELIQETTAALSELEKAVATGPQSFSLQLDKLSLEKRYHELEAAFEQATKELSVDVCRYRFFLDRGDPNALAVTTALSDFQQLVSLVCDAAKNGPKQRARTRPEIVRETSFGIGNMFRGSIGFVLTVPSERPLLQDESSALDGAIDVIFTAVTNRSAEGIAKMSRELGPSVVRGIYKWVNDHLEHWMGMDIKWMRGNEVKAALLAQQQELKDLEAVIRKVTEKIDEDVEIEGIYVGGDVDKETVHFKIAGAADINAHFHESFDANQLPHDFRIPVRANFVKRTKIHLATEMEEIRYLVTRIKQLSN